MRLDDYRYFILERNGNPTYSFTGYTDRETGALKQIFKGRKDTKTGDDIPHRFKFDRAHRSIRVHKDETDIHGNNVADHIANFPKCKDSKNAYLTDDGTQIDVRFSEIKEHESAITAIEAKALHLEAGNTALNLEADELKEIATIYGVFIDDEARQRHRILEEAGADPARFMEIYNSVERRANALIIKAIRAGVITVKGTIYSWEDKTLGLTKDLAVSKLLEDEELFQALEENIKAKGMS